MINFFNIDNEFLDLNFSFSLRKTNNHRTIFKIYEYLKSLYYVINVLSPLIINI